MQSLSSKGAVVQFFSLFRQRFICRQTALLMLLLAGTTGAAADCTKDEAQQKMRALQQIYSENSNVEGEAGRRYSFMARDIAMVGHLLASNQFAQACAEYDAIASKYEVDLAGALKRLAPVSNPKAKAAGTCDALTANLRVNGVYAKFEKKQKAAGASGDEIALQTSQLMNDLAPAFPLVQTEPEGACKIVADVERKYGLK